MGASDNLNGALVAGLQILFLMHPLATALTFSVIFLTFFLNTRDATIAAFLLSSLGAGAATFAFAADIAFVAVAKIRVNQLSQGQFKILYGNATWMVSSQPCSYFMSSSTFSNSLDGCWCGVLLSSYLLTAASESGKSF